MTPDDLTERDVVEYLVGVYRQITNHQVVHVVNQNDNLVEVVNALIVTLAPIAAYHLCHGYDALDQTPVQPASAPDDDGNLKSN